LLDLLGKHIDAPIADERNRPDNATFYQVNSRFSTGRHRWKNPSSANRCPFQGNFAGVISRNGGACRPRDVRAATKAPKGRAAFQRHRIGWRIGGPPRRNERSQFDPNECGCDRNKKHKW
jgi:hypothetical protein